MNELSLFTGVGGGLLATRDLGWRCVGYVERDKYCQRVLAQRISDGHLDEAPIFGDIDRFIESGDCEAFRGLVDVVTAGFPCPPFSCAGKREGASDDRDKWPQTLDAIRLVRPTHVLLENVPGIAFSGYLSGVVGGLATLGYVGSHVRLGAIDVGSQHIRRRIWLWATMADPNSG